MGQSEQGVIDWRNSIMTACTIIKTESKQDLESSITDSQKYKQIKQITLPSYYQLWVSLELPEASPHVVCFLLQVTSSSGPMGISTVAVPRSSMSHSSVRRGWAGPQSRWLNTAGAESRVRKDMELGRMHSQVRLSQSLSQLGGWGILRNLLEEILGNL